jgi:hypothetical protein
MQLTIAFSSTKVLSEFDLNTFTGRMLRVLDTGKSQFDLILEGFSEDYNR